LIGTGHHVARMSDSSKVMQKRVAGVPAIIYLWTCFAVLGKTYIFQGIISSFQVIKTLQISKQPRKMSIKIKITRLWSIWKYISVHFFHKGLDVFSCFKNRSNVLKKQKKCKFKENTLSKMCCAQTLSKSNKTSNTEKVRRMKGEVHYFYLDWVVFRDLNIQPAGHISGICIWIFWWRHIPRWWYVIAAAI